ncbi:MAG TPA: hypothetical protein EYN51_05735, partial [Flavobacteriales bacterium]|nr:hypothetical protein [Flavobacteriales bacterium]
MRCPHSDSYRLFFAVTEDNSPSAGYTHLLQIYYDTTGVFETFDDQWHHGVIVIGNGNNSIYIDGNDLTEVFNVGNSSTNAFTNIFTSESFVIGAARAWNLSGALGGFFDGSIDDIAIYNRALDSTEIQQLYTLGQYDINWSTGDTTSSITVSPTTNTTYSVTVDDGIGTCSDSVIVTVSNPQVNLGDTVSACGDSILIDAGSGYDTYAWNVGDTTQSIYAQVTGTYRVTVSDTVGCTATDSVFVSLVKAEIEQPDTAICLGDSLTLAVDSPLGNNCISLPTNLQNGLVVQYPFCGNANDESGNGYHCTVNGATLTTDRFGNLNSAYSFDGVDDHLIRSTDMTDSLYGLTQGSISIWFKTTNNPNAITTLLY